ncbi:MAG: PrsW family intramembrane metalloprotease, partial [Candidatus Aminicenantes bacterium]|nr:PrsW family intramembrane metalloprotease [Candidatus Aminicenantes bacterium]
FSVFSAIILGITSALLVIIVRKIFPLPDYTSNPSWTNVILVSFFSAGFIEELAKFALIVGLIYKWTDFNEYYDGPLYAGLVGIGFAIYENLGYMIKPLVKIIDTDVALNPSFLREIALKSLVQFRLYPGHFFLGFIAGYFIAKAKFEGVEKGKHRERIYILSGFFVAVFLHGIFNLIAVKGNFIMFFGYVIFLLLIVVILGWKSLRKSVFKKEIIERLPERKKYLLKEILLKSKEEKVTFDYVFFLAILIILYQFFAYFMTYMISMI